MTRSLAKENPSSISSLPIYEYMMRDTSEASQRPPYRAGQRLEKSISLPTNAMHTQNDMNQRFNYEIPEHPAKPNTDKASQMAHNMARQRLEKTISLPINAMHAQNDTKEASQTPNYMLGQRFEKSISLPGNAMQAPKETKHRNNYDIAMNPTEPKTIEASQIPYYMAEQRFEDSISLHAQNDMKHWFNYEAPEHPMYPKTNRSTSEAKPKAKSSRIYHLSCASVSDIKRQKRLTGYYAYTAEGKLKASMRNTFSWFKDKYDTIVHGY